MFSTLNLCEILYSTMQFISENDLIVDHHFSPHIFIKHTQFHFLPYQFGTRSAGVQLWPIPLNSLNITILPNHVLRQMFSFP
jgi:hypothetical protein